ncbi:MAG: preprotein translocase subunit SecE [Candidatus Margulisbacteria bacterium]|nr:preprotein translocase subunit SecE [Candidatus Margulisiibacteriota bacterium]
MKKVFEQIIKFIKETRAETKKVIWPNRRYVAVATVIIIIICFAVGFYVMFIDFAFTKILGALIK